MKANSIKFGIISVIVVALSFFFSCGRKLGNYDPNEYRLRKEVMRNLQEEELKKEQEWEHSSNTKKSVDGPSNTNASSSDSKPTKISSPTGYINGHGYVDLGLSVKWATCNVGASSPSDYGNYYAWGETSTKASYRLDNSKTYGKTMASIEDNHCDPSYGVARAKWGGTWRMPTMDEIDELINKCTHTWTKLGGHNGYKVTGPNGNSIFLPASGSRYETSLYNVGKLGFYWSGTPDVTVYSACILDFDCFDFGMMGFDGRFYGLSVRPVSE